jgi:hypothetical protein
MKEISNLTWGQKETFNNFKTKVLQKLAYARTLNLTDEQIQFFATLPVECG